MVPRRSNVVNYNEYQELFTGMIKDWRDYWGYDFPFYYAQIAPFDYAEKSEGRMNCVMLRKNL